MKRKIVILDGFRINPGDLSWEPITQLGDVKIFDRTPPDEILNHIGDAPIVLTNKAVITADDIAHLPNLKYIGILATGMNVVDIEAAEKHGIIVTNIPAYSTMSVAQMAITLLLTITGRVEHYTDEIRRGEWSKKPDFCYWNHNLTELDGKIIGIVGFGHTGQAVAKIALALGMQPLLYTSRSQSEIPVGMRKAQSLDSLFSESDVISLHCPLTEDNVGMVNSEKIALMKKNAILINTARGGLVDEDALARALHDNQIYAAGLDVLSMEPPSPDNPLLHAPNCFITPHIAWATLESRKRLIDIAASNLRRYLESVRI